MSRRHGRHASSAVARRASLGIVIVAVGDDAEGPLWAQRAGDARLRRPAGRAARRARSSPPTASSPLLLVLALAPDAAAATASSSSSACCCSPTPPGASREPALPSAFMPALLAGITAANLALTRPAAGDWIFPPAISRRRLRRRPQRRLPRRAGRRAARGRRCAPRRPQAADERRAVADERRRIAREMHDVVAHSISVMVVQAGGARRILERDPQRADAGRRRRSSAPGRETLLEMRRLLGVMHGDTEPAELEPSPTLADLRRPRATRLGARPARSSATPQPVAAGLELGAYRVVEEALDDVRRVGARRRADGDRRAGRRRRARADASPTTVPTPAPDARRRARARRAVRRRRSTHRPRAPTATAIELDVRFPPQMPAQGVT